MTMEEERMGCSADVDIEGTVAGVAEEEHVEIEDRFADRRQELKELRAELLSLRRAAKSADKKQKKALTDQIMATETLIETKRTSLEAEERQAEGARLVREQMQQPDRRELVRAKKLAQQHRRAEQERVRREDAFNLASQIPQLGKQEREAFAQILAQEELYIHDIKPDGNCMFAAIAHQLAHRHQRAYEQAQLRQVAAQYISEHAHKYEAFLEEPLAEYCQKIRGELWGGHLELDAISNALLLQIKVFQADAPPIIFSPQEATTNGHQQPPREEHPQSDQNQPPQICIAFQKYAYTLGEHYDSLI